MSVICYCKNISVIVMFQWAQRARLLEQFWPPVLNCILFLITGVILCQLNGEFPS